MRVVNPIYSYLLSPLLPSIFANDHFLRMVFACHETLQCHDVSDLRCMGYLGDVLRQAGRSRTRVSHLALSMPRSLRLSLWLFFPLRL